MSTKGSENGTKTRAKMEPKMELNVSLGAPGADFCDFGRVLEGAFSDNFENAQKGIHKSEKLRFGPPEEPTGAKFGGSGGAPS